MAALTAARQGAPRPLLAGLLAVVALPLVVAAVTMRRPVWMPVLDLAMTELRLRDVGGADTPLVGLPGRIGTFERQGSHPGPLSFYLLAPTYRLLGSSAWSMVVAAVVLHVGAIAAALAIAARRGGRTLALGTAAMLAVLSLGYGVTALSEPWNPYLPLLWWIVVLLAVWSVACGDLLMLPVAVAAASFCAQTHVPYLALCLGLGALAALAWLVAVRSAPAAATRRRALRWGALAAVVGVVLWAPPTIDQLTNDPGNYRMIVEHLVTPPEGEVPAGVAEAVTEVSRRLDVVHVVTDGSAEPGVLVPGSLDRPASPGRGQAVLAVWVLAVAGAVWLRDRRLLLLHAVVAVALLLAVLAVSRIFGFMWFYLMLWIWGVAALMVLATISTAATWASRALPPDRARRAGRIGAVCLAAVAVAASARLALDAPGASRSDHELSAVLAPLVAPTAAALEAGTGAADGDAGRYLVVWDDSTHIGSQGYGLLSELERRGFDVGAAPLYRVPATPQRTLTDAEATARVVLVTGEAAIDAWRALPGAVEVARVDPRSAADDAELALLRTRVVDDLEAAGLAELVPHLDENLFTASIDVRVPFATQLRMAKMLQLGVPTAVFVAAPGTSVE